MKRILSALIFAALSLSASNARAEKDYIYNHIGDEVYIMEHQIDGITCFSAVFNPRVENDPDMGLVHSVTVCNFWNKNDKVCWTEHHKINSIRLHYTGEIYTGK